MESMAVLSINIAKPQQVQFNMKEIATGIFKQPAQGVLYLSLLNIEGDGQADLVHHGGPDKAVCVYPHEHYAFWENELQRELTYGAFGENLTLHGLTESEVSIGDQFILGEAIVQVSQPRQPCFKLSVKYGVPDLPLKVQDTGYTGFYFRVLKEGYVSASDSLTILSRHPAAITVEYANRIMHHDKQDVQGIRRILAVEELSGSWRTTLAKRLGGIGTDEKERLEGAGAAHSTSTDM